MGLTPAIELFMKNTFYLLFILLASACSVSKTNSVSKADVERMMRTLSSDEMQGREVFTHGIEKAAKFIEDEFRKIGLESLPGETSYRQQFSMFSVKPLSLSVKVNGNEIDSNQVMVITDKRSLSWTESTGAEIHYIKSGESFMSRYREIRALNKTAIVFVEPEFRDAFTRMRGHFMRGRVLDQLDEQQAAVFIINVDKPSRFEVAFVNEVKEQPLANIAGVIKGKSKAQEYVIFSGHYDHIGVLPSVKGDSIANGADDDASGITAVIGLAKHYRHLNNNARTLVFVAFTAEEAGAIGSKYFSEKLNPDEIVAMFNIEMIGKESKFGNNAAFITGFEKSDFGKILQRNVEGSNFVFHPDPYPEQQLFYRSDNATLAALGVPAHTISTVQIDKDTLYHTVDDELETLNLENILATIKAIALGSVSIVSGQDTPSRIPPLEPRKD